MILIPLRTAFLNLALLALMCCTPQVGAAPAVLTDDRGVAQTFQHSPKRVVTLLPSLTETVCVLGACERLVGTDRYSRFPLQVQKLPKLGGLDDLSVERIVALRPDVVLMSASTPRVADRLEALGIRVLVLEAPDLKGVRRVLSLVSKLLQIGDAQQVWQAMERDAQAIVAQAPAKTRGWRVYDEIDNSIYAAGAASFIGQTLSRLGLHNIVGPEFGPFPKLNPEFVVRADPQLIVVSQQEVSALRLRPGWHNITALQRQQICGLTPAELDLVNRPGPRLAEGMRVLLRCLQRFDSSAL
jgi:iron complex transport system substrate-binding protein